MDEYPQLKKLECRNQRATLVHNSMPGTGLVTLDAFYGNAVEGLAFDEKTDYLSVIGALDGHQNVRIANYMRGPATCNERSPFVSVCCVSECDGILSELMDMVRAPFAPVDVVLQAVASIAW